MAVLHHWRRVAVIAEQLVVAFAFLRAVTMRNRLRRPILSQLQQLGLLSSATMRTSTLSHRLMSSTGTYELMACTPSRPFMARERQAAEPRHGPRE